MEVSESTVTLLKVAETAAESAARSAEGSTGASVVMTAIMVAMLGMIMPEPLHMPPTMNFLPAKAGSALSHSTAHSLGCVSVVMMAHAAPLPPSRESA